MALTITLLGAPRVERDEKLQTFDTRKAVALLAHLALAERPRSREALCELLWPAHDPDRARGALRRTLSTLRTAIGEEWIDTTGDSIALRRGPGLDLDVRRFRELAADTASQESLGAAVSLFAGGFLEGFSLRDSPEFDHWQGEQARGLERELASALRRLVERLVARGDCQQAVPNARRWLELDPLQEPAHRVLIQLYAWSGDRAAALEQYRQCVRTLTQELGVSPLQETATLYEQVNDGTLLPPPEAEAPRAAPTPVKAVMGPLELPLVGRTDELSTLVGALARARPDGGLAVIEGEGRRARRLAGRAGAPAPGGCLASPSRARGPERRAGRSAAARGSGRPGAPARGSRRCNRRGLRRARAGGRLPRRRPCGGRGYARRGLLPRSQARRPGASARGGLAQRGGAAGPSPSSTCRGPGPRRESRDREPRPADRGPGGRARAGGSPRLRGARAGAAGVSRERGPAAVRVRVPGGPARGRRRPGGRADALGGEGPAGRATRRARRRRAPGARRSGGDRPILRPRHGPGGERPRRRGGRDRTRGAGRARGGE